MEHIVVAVDGSPTAAQALRWALHEGGIREAGVTAVLAWDFLGQHHPDGSTKFDPDFGEPQAAESLDAYVNEAVGADKAALVFKRVVFGLPADAILEAAQTASMLVLGARGRGGFRQLLLGSVSQRCLHLAECNVAIIRTDRDKNAPTGRIVVGIDGSAHGQAALAWAVREALFRSAKLRVVHANAEPPIAMSPFAAPLPVGPSDPASARELIANALSAVADAEAVDVEAVDVEIVPAVGSASRALLEASSDSDLIVIGRFGRSLLSGLAMGSVATQIGHHATVPAIFINSADDRPPTT